MGRTHATRNLKHASSDTLEKLRDASAVLVAHEHQISPHLMTDLLLIREEPQPLCTTWRTSASTGHGGR